MDAITHTILALASIAGAWYGGRALLVRQARRFTHDMTSPEMLRHIRQLDRLIEQMTFEDEAHIHGTEVGEHQPLQLELFAHRGADREEQA